jgi:hypothetical protein
MKPKTGTFLGQTTILHLVVFEPQRLRIRREHLGQTIMHLHGIRTKIIEGFEPTSHKLLNLLSLQKAIPRAVRGVNTSSVTMPE